MLTHREIWQAIDTLAQRSGLSASGLARAAGLDPTTFNRSKRMASNGKQRWPSTESLSKALEAAGTSMEEFVGFIRDGGTLEDVDGFANPGAFGGGIPVIGLAQAGTGGFFGDAGFPVGGAWERVDLPGASAGAGDENMYALEISGDSMAPVYRKGDIIVVSPAAAVRVGDRVVAKTLDGEVMAKELRAQNSKRIVLASLNPSFEDLEFKPSQIQWLARIVWARQ
ncbi:S24 family peptidase [Pyruvatibacter sp. HU-CL02332]|uniref:S24 family peptidase n=1 Tax=Pyruvatibacter sp. HU-CL02332 TaxID=3127650 RepID=UPI0031030BF7